MRRVGILTIAIGIAFALGAWSGRVARAGDFDRDQAQQSATQQANDQFVGQVSAQIAGREGEPAEQVFKNVRWLKGIRAGQLLTIMNRGYSAALGVTCTHCHNEQDFSSDEKRPKRAAREMAAMHRSINTTLAGMEHLSSPSANRAISCSACHRGAVDPRTAR